MTGDAFDYPFHVETRTFVLASAEALFAHLDDHARLSAHGGQRSWPMGGGRMAIDTDARGGKAVGSRITLSGEAFGIHLLVDEIVTERTPPLRKVWITVGAPHLLVIGAYQMGFQIRAQGPASSLRVFIDYALPNNALPQAMRARLADAYARWCTQRMANDAARHFKDAIAAAA